MKDAFEDNKKQVEKKLTIKELKSMLKTSTSSPIL